MREPPETQAGAGSVLRIARTHDRERFFCALFAPPPARPALFALLALNHELGSIAEKVSEPILGQIRLAWWREAIAAIGEGEAGAHPLAGELSRACRTGRIDAGVLGDLVEARQADFSGQPGEDIDSLVEYARRTSGALHRAMMSAIDPAAGKDALRAAELTGTAWGLVGALRSLPYHMQGGGGPFAALAEMARPRLQEVSEEVSRRAQAAISEARHAAPKLARGQLAPLLPAAMAKDYLRRLAKAGYDPLEAPFERGPLRRRMAVLCVWVRGAI